MNLRERKLWDRLRPKLNAAGIYTERIENAVGSGKPDVDTLHNGCFLPCELKAVAAFPKRKTTAVLGKKCGLRQSQLNWFLNWRRFGGKALIIVGVGTDVYTFGQADSDSVNHFNSAQFRAAALASGVHELIELIKEFGR